jgi:hypothetical protein
MTAPATLFFCFVGLIVIGAIMFFNHFYAFNKTDEQIAKMILKYYEKQDDENSSFKRAMIFVILMSAGSFGALVSGIVWIVNKFAH